MKKLFVITTIKQKEKETVQNISPIKLKSDEEKSKLELDLPQIQSESTNLCQSPKTDSSDYSRKYSLNALSTDNSIAANLNNILEENNNNIEKKQFLGKKKKFHFNIIKPFPESNKKEINITNIKTELNNNDNNNQNIHKALVNRQKPKLKFLKFKSTIIFNKKKNIKEGRWTKEENMKFIEAFIENGKKWKIIQNNIGTRTCTQTRSHAQKFLLKLKSISNEEFNFKNDSIKNLNDILEEIKKKKGIENLNNNEEKKSIIDILLNLTERCGENNIIGSNKKNNLNDNSNNEDDKSIEKNKEKENISIKEEKITKSYKKNINENMNNKNEENINNSNKLIDDKSDKKEKIQKMEEINNKNIKKNECCEYNYNFNYLYEPIDQKLVFDEGFAFYINKNSIYNFNNISYYINEYNFNRNIEKSRFFNRDYFS